MDPVDGETLPCTRETTNRHDPFAVKITKSAGTIVGHLLRMISSTCSMFLYREGTISTTVTGPKCYSRDF